MSLKTDIIKLLHYSNVDPLINQWKVEKQYLYEKFGKQLIIKSNKEISISLSKEQKIELFYNFLSEVKEKTDNKDFIDYLHMNSRSFLDNTISFSFDTANLPIGGKLIKSFKYYIKDAALLREIQDIASTYIQNNKIKGYLYLSIHPLDYLLLSDNNHNWTTCHSLKGEYKNGNLSYMVDKTTIVAYLASAEKENIKGVEWYSKKWRCLLHVRPNGDTVYFNKQYPFTNEKLYEEVLSFFCFSLHQENLIFQKVESKRLRDKYIICGDHIFNIYEIMTDNSCIFNDIIYNFDFTPRIARTKPLSFDYFQAKEQMKIEIGGIPICIKCGKALAEEPYTSLCLNCYLEEENKNDT